IASMTRSSWSVFTAASIFTLGRKSTTYSAPRYSSVWPFCRPKPLTSVTVIPCTPIAESASRTSSSLNGLMMALTIFICAPPSERPADRQHERAVAGLLAVRRVPGLAGGVPALRRVAANQGRAEHPAMHVVAEADLVVGVVELAVVLHLL